MEKLKSIILKIKLLKERYIAASIISLVMLGFVIMHLHRPDYKVDNITITLLIIAVVPWLGSIFQSIKGPGGWGFDYRTAMQPASEEELQDKLETDAEDEARVIPKEGSTDSINQATAQDVSKAVDFENLVISEIRRQNPFGASSFTTGAKITSQGFSFIVDAIAESEYASYIIEIKYKPPFSVLKSTVKNLDIYVDSYTAFTRERGRFPLVVPVIIIADDTENIRNEISGTVILRYNEGKKQFINLELLANQVRRLRSYHGLI